MRAASDAEAQMNLKPVNTQIGPLQPMQTLSILWLPSVLKRSFRVCIECWDD